MGWNRQLVDVIFGPPLNPWKMLMALALNLAPENGPLEKEVSIRTHHVYKKGPR